MNQNDDPFELDAETTDEGQIDWRDSVISKVTPSSDLAEGIPDAWLGVNVGGFLFGAVAVLFGFTLNVGSFTSSSISLLLVIPAMLIFGGISFFMATMISIISMNLAGVACVCFPRHVTSRFAIGLFGGMTGFLLSFPIWFIRTTEFGPVWKVIFCSAAILSCYFGGVIKGRSTSSSNVFHSPMFPAAWSFKVIDLVQLTFWIAVLFGVSRIYPSSQLLYFAATISLVVTLTVCVFVDSLIFPAWKDLNHGRAGNKINEPLES
ncbi:MAG: hypothetical protein AAFN77_10570 [Planctomycetota bacterium]